MSNPLRDPLSWDFAYFAGVITSGIATVSGGVDARGWDTRKGYGQSGATRVYTGRELKSFTLRLYFWHEVQIDWYREQILPVIAPEPIGKTAKAIEFYHPAVSEEPHGIRAVDVDEIGQLTPDGDSGGWYVEIKLTRYARPKPAVGKPSGAAAKTPKPPTAAEKADAEIEALTKQMKELANG